MSECMIVRRGGTKADVFAFIVVTYPSGSTCIATNGVLTLRAKDTSGLAVFQIPNRGDFSQGQTWTIRCVNASYVPQLEASQNVLVTTMGQSIPVILKYALYLYNASASSVISERYNPEVTGGWNNIGWKVSRTTGYPERPLTLTETTDSDNVRIQQENGSGVYLTNNKINFYGFTKLICTWRNPSENSTYFTVFQGTKSEYEFYSDARIAYEILNDSGVSPSVIDISELNGEYYVGFSASRNSGSTSSVRITSVYLET